MLGDSACKFLFASILNIESVELLMSLFVCGSVIVAFSNRMFFTKAPQIWTDSSDSEHLDYVSSVLEAQGWVGIERLAETTQASGLSGWLGGQGDPFFAVIGHRQRP